MNKLTIIDNKSYRLFFQLVKTRDSITKFMDEFFYQFMRWKINYQFSYNSYMTVFYAKQLSKFEDKVWSSIKNFE